MIRHPDSTRAALTLAVAVLTLLAAAAASGSVAAQGDRPTVGVESATVTADGTVTVDVVLTSAPDGLAGYLLELSVDGDAARIESAGYPGRFGVTSDPVVGPEGRTVTVEAADLEGNVQAGATDVTLVTVTLAGADAGEATLTADPVQFDADGGTAFEPATRSGSLTVEAAATATPGGGEAVSTAGADGASDGAGASGASQQTSSSGPLSPALVLVALVVLTTAALTRYAR
ncbi:MAG: hypothetical protein V5A31_09480 [Haloferacaceae archaeon]